MNDFKFFQKETANDSQLNSVEYRKIHWEAGKMMFELMIERTKHFPGYERGEINGVVGGTGMAYSIMRNSIFGGGYERVEIRGDMVTLNEGIDNK